MLFSSEENTNPHPPPGVVFIQQPGDFCIQLLATVEHLGDDAVLPVGDETQLVIAEIDGDGIMVMAVE